MVSIGGRGSWRSIWGGALGSAALAGLLAGCANPGPPRPPSLHLPEAPRDLTADRTGSIVELRFTAPKSSTDKLPLRVITVRGSYCRQVGKGPCVTPPGAGGSFALWDAGRPAVVVWHDTLPAELTSGPARVMCYRLELFNASGQSAGFSDAAYTVAGEAPARVEGLTAEGSRAGVVLRWNAAGGAGDDVLLRREGRVATPAKGPGKVVSSQPRSSTLSQNHDSTARQDVVWMDATPAADDRALHRSLDASALPGVAYRYQATRRETVKLGGRTLELRSELSEPAAITLQQIYASAAPTGLVAAAFDNSTGAGASGGFAVDLVWQPVDDADLAGYLVYRERIDANGQAVGVKEKLTATPDREPGFHDATAKAMERYRYSVTAEDTHGNESAAVTTVLEPTETP